MNTTTIRVSSKTRALLATLSKASGLPMQDIVEQALEAYRRQQMLAAANDAYASLRSDDRAWQDWANEQEVWDATIADGLDDS